MIQIPVQDLRRVVAALSGLRGKTITDFVMRTDLRQLKVAMAEGQMLVIALEQDDSGRSHLSVDVVMPTEEPGRQLEVGLGAQPG